MSDDFLAKTKGFKNVFVVQSNANPYAAAAAMGMMLSRSAEAGRFFRPSDSFVPMIDERPIDDKLPNSDASQIEARFKEDWVEYLQKVALPACGLEYSTSMTPERNTIRFLNAGGRRIPPLKVRRVHKSRELSIPAEYAPDFAKLVALVEAGGDLKPYLSRDIIKKKRPDRNDGLIYSWGIQHLHFRDCGTDHVLFCVITDADLFVIQALPHNAEHLWVYVQLIQIIHDNWPSLISRSKHSGLQPEELSPARRSALRGYNANFLITVNDGTVYLPPTGGTMASGDSQEDCLNCDKIFSELDYWQSLLTANVAANEPCGTPNQIDRRPLVAIRGREPSGLVPATSVN